MNNYLDTLNDRQLEAVKQVEGPVLIMAGAGSGKTKALTCRIAHMLELGIRPGEILAITFTNKAAKEMRDRVHSLVGPQADRIWMYTFHSFGARFLRREINNYPPYTDKFTIYDSDDSKQLVKNSSSRTPSRAVFPPPRTSSFHRRPSASRQGEISTTRRWPTSTTSTTGT